MLEKMKEIIVYASLVHRCISSEAIRSSPAAEQLLIQQAMSLHTKTRKRLSDIRFDILLLCCMCKR